jgi:hypothetical protein
MTAILRSLAALCLALVLSHCASQMRPVPVVAFTDHRHAMLFSEMVYEEAETGQKIVVPEGFVTDHASIPPSIKHYFEIGGQAYQYPAILHDWLYWSQTTTRAEADAIFNSAMKDCGVGDVKRRAILAGVRAGGGKAWEKNRKEREAGLIKVIPAAYRDPQTWPKNVSWPKYREWLRTQRVSEPVLAMVKPEEAGRKKP